MPNINTAVRLMDGTRQGRFLLTGSFDGASGQEAGVLKINSWGLNGALSNATNSRQLLASALNGSYNRGQYFVTITKIQHVISPGGLVTLHLANTARGPIATNTLVQLSGTGEIGAGRGEEVLLDLARFPDSANMSGNILLTTSGMGANTGYTIAIDFLKDPTKYDQGQVSNPTDFNQG
jgi:hypothetical protein